MQKTVILILVLTTSAPTLALEKCVENGKAVITDRPCPNQTAATSGQRAVSQSVQPRVVGAGDYDTSSGSWRGQVQLMAKSGGSVINEAHAVVPFVLEIDPRGKVTGFANEAGCKLVGIARPSIAPTITELDVTLTECRYSGYNRQLTGRLGLFKQQGYADFLVQAYDMNKHPVAYFEVKGTLRR